LSLNTAKAHIWVFPNKITPKPLIIGHFKNYIGSRFIVCPDMHFGTILESMSREFSFLLGLKLHEEDC